MEKPIIGLTQGDTNGVGLEIVLKTILPEGFTDICTPVVFANKRLLIRTLQMMGETMKFQTIESAADARRGKINVVDLPEHPVEVKYGEPTAESGLAALASLEAACAALEAGDIDALVTAPISKEAIQSDAFRFPGHTEYLEARFADADSPEDSARQASMILFNDDLRVALMTTHLPLAKVSGTIRADKIVETVARLDRTLRRDFACDRPRIAVLSLNPHNGDGGLLGDEEQREIIPAIHALAERKILAFGPYSADGFFGSGQWREFDAVLAMYHDQGLIPFKTLAGQSGVNFTSGLEVIRTSPDHGTAYDIAGRNLADPDSMREAVYKAIDLLRARKRYDEFSANPLPVSVHKSSNKPQ